MKYVELRLWDFGRLFYIVSPNETTFKTVEEVPNYIDAVDNNVVLHFVSHGDVVFVLNEKRLFSNKRCYNKCSMWNDATSNTVGFMIIQYSNIRNATSLFPIFFITEQYYAWDSISTWIISFILVDFSFYWFHRGAHEINFIWAFHQVHHSSEEFNYSTATRQSMIEQFVSIFYYLPEAFFLPPAAHLVHMMLNKICQFWVHTQVIKTVGPLEFIFVTPSHHRVHHGRNRYCIDKNYAGILIIWDKIFGTFQAEKLEEPVIFGLVHNVNSFDVFHCQLLYFKYLFLEKIPSMTNLADKVKALLYGPGWYPGTPRLGHLSDIPEIIYPVVKYDPKVSTFITFYTILHFGFTLFIYFALSSEREDLTNFQCLIFMFIIILSVKCSSGFLEKKSFASHLELLRCSIMYFWFSKIVWPSSDPLHLVCKYFYGGSFLFWFIEQTFENLSKIIVKLKNYYKLKDQKLL